MLIALSPIQSPEEWTLSAEFFAFDVPIPGTCVYSVHHCLRR
jgi:hypothetical protein